MCITSGLLWIFAHKKTPRFHGVFSFSLEPSSWRGEKAHQTGLAADKCTLQPDGQS